MSVALNDNELREATPLPEEGVACGGHGRCEELLGPTCMSFSQNRTQTEEVPKRDTLAAAAAGDFKNDSSPISKVYSCALRQQLAAR